jgi:hypothetical protein
VFHIVRLPIFDTDGGFCVPVYAVPIADPVETLASTSELEIKTISIDDLPPQVVLPAPIPEPCHPLVATIEREIVRFLTLETGSL